MSPATTTERTWRDQVAGIATLHDVGLTEVEGWLVCLCTDDRHGIEDRVGNLREKERAERDRLYVGGSHVVHARRVVLDELTAVTS
jgi:hypothetical protein